MTRVHGVVVISGANGSLGFELTRSLLRNHQVTKVYAGCRSIEKMEDLQRLLDPEKKLRLLELDISKDWSIRTAMEAVEKDSGHIDMLFNNAAILELDHRAGVPKGDRVSWLRHFDINVVSHAMMIQEFLPLLKKSQSATIVNISSVEGSVSQQTVYHDNIAYVCSKAALNKLTRTIASEFPAILTVSMCPVEKMERKGVQRSRSSEFPPSILNTLNSLTSKHSGYCFDSFGEMVPF